MYQDQNTQTCHPNNNISEGFGERQLENVTGGCVGCGAISFGATHNAEAIAKAVPKIADANKSLSVSLIGHGFKTLASNAHASAQGAGVEVCRSYGQHKSTFHNIVARRNAILPGRYPL